MPVVAVLAACSTSPGDGSGGGASENHSTEPPRGAPTSGSAPPASPAPSSPASTRTASPAAPSPSSPAVPSSAPAACVAGRTEVTVAPDDAPRRRLCVRPGTVVSLVLQARTDDKRWTAVRSSAPVFVLASGWRVDADGTAHASLRPAGTRGGSATITALAKAADVAGAARVTFTLDLTVTPQAREG
ncbi:hypothetical protein ACIA8I_30905 [Streptomyces rishiriensis]|uniref:hypothetical protein n=1 Tax=Streptomyces rishiriensis TaxID=68264 RepID=UPI00378EB843